MANVAEVDIAPWAADWAWGLPLILLTVVIHVFGLALINDGVIQVLRRTAERRRASRSEEAGCPKAEGAEGGDQSRRRQVMNFMPGDIQFLHNHTILHVRSAYEDWPEGKAFSADVAGERAQLLDIAGRQTDL